MKKNNLKNLVLIGACMFILFGIYNTVVRNQEQAQQEQQHVERYHQIYKSDFGIDVLKEQTVSNEKAKITFAEHILSATDMFGAIVTKDAMDIKVISNASYDLVKVNDLVYHIRFNVDADSHGKILLVVTSNDSVIIHSTREY